MNAEILRISEEEYHADPCPAPSLSASVAKVLVEKTPRHAWQMHPRLGGVSREPTATMERGTLIHKLVLGAGREFVEVAAKDWRTKAAQEQRDAARAGGLVPVLAADLDDAREAALRITENLAASGVVLSGESELSVTWQEPARDGAVWCRTRMDHFISEVGATIFDLKTSRSAHPKACSRHVIDYGYTIQRAAYVRAIERRYPDTAGRVAFVFAFVETEPPYEVGVYELDGMLREHGERLWSEAVDAWSHCLATGEWPGYRRERVQLEAPGWLMASMEGM